MFCDRLEHRLKGSAQEKLLQSIFTGELSNQLVCTGGCNSIRTQLETYYCMSMQVQHKKNLEESLEHMVKVCDFPFSLGFFCCFFFFLLILLLKLLVLTFMLASVPMSG